MVAWNGEMRRSEDSGRESVHETLARIDERINKILEVNEKFSDEIKILRSKAHEATNLMSVHELRLTDNKEKIKSLDDRTSLLEKYQWKSIGFSAAIASVITLVGELFISRKG